MDGSKIEENLCKVIERRLFMKIIVNSQIMERESFHVDIEDRGYQFGDGIYEVVRIYDGKFFTMDEHLARLERSANELKLPIPVTISDLKENAQKLIEIENIRDGIIYIQVTRGTAPRVHSFPANISSTLVAYATPMSRPVKALSEGVATVLVEDIRWLRCDIKSINLLGNVLAKEAAREAGAFEAIQHRGNIVTEGSSTNIWMIKNQIIYSHPVSNLILNGITRQLVIELAHELGFKVMEKEYTVEELLNADEVFLTSTTSEVMPIISIQGKKVGAGVPGSITTKLQDSFVNKISLLSV